MNFLGSNKLAILLALFTQRMFMDVSVTDPFPRSAITFSGCRIPIVFFITSGFQLGMFLTEPI